MHPFLINQNLTYGIYLIEPLANLTFNRGLLMNIGFIESLKDSNHLWDCFFFHDVDMLPEDLRNYYKCDYDLPVHYAVAVSKFGYSYIKLKIKNIFHWIYIYLDFKNNRLLGNILWWYQCLY